MNNRRLFLTTDDTTPAGIVLYFSNETDVANYYGVGSYQASMATTYFSGASGATMMFSRVPEGQRPHLIGANLAGLPQVNGSLALTFDGFNYGGNVNLVGVTNWEDAAKAITTALHGTLPIAATTAGDTLTKVTVNFTGWTNWSEVYVTNASGPIPVGAIIQDGGVNLPAYDGKGNDEVILTHPNGIVDLYGPAGDSYDPTPRPMTATYYDLHIGSVTSGAVEPGLRLDDGTPLSAITEQLGQNDWVVNYAANSPSTGDFNVTAPSLIASWNLMHGKTENHEFFMVQPEGVFDFNHIPADLSYAAGTAANALGLSQEGGAMDSLTTYQEATYPAMLSALALISGGFGSFQSDNIRPAAQFAAWGAANGVTYLAGQYVTTTPAGDDGPHYY